MTYYDVGKLIVEAQGGEARAKYGDRLITEYSKKLTLELGKGYSIKNLTRMRKFYLFEKVSTILSWSHYSELLELNKYEEIKYYIDISNKYNLSVRELRNRIKSKEFERLDEETKAKLRENDGNMKYEVQDFIKHPVVIKNKYNVEEITEKYLKQLILKDMDQFLLQLGSGFAYI